MRSKIVHIVVIWTVNAGELLVGLFIHELISSGTQLIAGLGFLLEHNLPRIIIVVRPSNFDDMYIPD